ncbi:HAMP domain-containing sensor histidine kinase [Nocardia rhamnosiphila]
MMDPMHLVRVLTQPARWGLRLRSALTSAAVVAVVIGAGAGMLVWSLYHSQLSALDTEASSRADIIAARLSDLGVDGVDQDMLAPDSRIDSVQIIDARGIVARASPGAPSTPLIDAAPGTDVTGQPICDEKDLRISARPAGTGDGSFVVLVAATGEVVEDAAKRIALGVALGGPVVVAVAAAATYALVGRSLRSVEAIRRQVAGIGATRLAERVPVPAARDEIGKLAETMNAMLDRLDAGQREQRRFVGDASHELKSPLSTIVAALELGSDDPRVLDHQMIIGTLQPEAERMRRLVDDLLMLAATDEHGLNLRMTDVDLDDLATVDATALRRQYPRLTIVTDLRPTRLTGDAGALARVVRNLTANAAVHAMSAITVRTDLVGTRARLIVDDDGPGIPPAERTRVFERFVRLQDDRARGTGGTGLGLAIVDRIVAAHQGTVRIEDAPSGGARLIVDLPIAPER